MPDRNVEVSTDILDEATPPVKTAEPATKPEANPAPARSRARRIKPVPHRIETFETVRPDGVRVLVRRDIDDGAQTVEIV